MSGWLLLILALTGLLLVANAAFPSRGPWLLAPSWLLAFLTTDLAPLHIVLQVGVAGACIGFGALQSLPGQVGAALLPVSAVWLLVLWRPNLDAGRFAHAFARANDLDEVAAVPTRLLLTPFRRNRPGVVVTRNIVFAEHGGEQLALDLYQPGTPGDRRPAFIYLHGGGWVIGDKREQGLPLCHHLASLGWVCANANYRLCPGATWPDQLVDASAAIAWLRAHAQEYGIDPGFVAIGGGSSGGHIAAMTALTAPRAGLPSPLASQDVSVQAVVCSYGIYDLTNRLGAHNPEFVTRMIGPLLLKASPETESEKFHAASPRDNAAYASQPWLLLHGDGDTLTPVVEARDFASALQEAAGARVLLAEFPAAQHGFDVFYTPRAVAAVELSARFLQSSYRNTGRSDHTGRSD